MTTKLFWLIPIFRMTTYQMYCSQCGKTKGLPKAKALQLIAMEQAYQQQIAAQAEPVFDEFKTK